MFCPNCGKQIKDYDNFCRFCGTCLQDEIEDINMVFPSGNTAALKAKKTEIPSNNGEELVLLEVNKHIMSLFWSVFFTPIFFAYFWNIFLNTHSILSWVVVIGLLAPVVYPILRYSSDKIIFTTHYVHIKIGFLNPQEIDIPLSELDSIDLTQSGLGKLLNYSCLSFNYNSEKYDYGYIKDFEEIKSILDNPEEYVKESMELSSF